MSKIQWDIFLNIGRRCIIKKIWKIARFYQVKRKVYLCSLRFPSNSRGFIFKEKIGTHFKIQAKMINNVGLKTSGEIENQAMRLPSENTLSYLLSLQSYFSLLLLTFPRPLFFFFNRRFFIFPLPHYQPISTLPLKSGFLRWTDLWHLNSDFWLLLWFLLSPHPSPAVWPFLLSATTQVHAGLRSSHSLCLEVFPQITKILLSIQIATQIFPSQTFPWPPI